SWKTWTTFRRSIPTWKYPTRHWQLTESIKSPRQPRVVLGIDPGIGTLGYGVIAGEADPRPLTYGCLITPAHAPVPERLSLLFDGLTEIRERYAITDVAMESLFVGSRLRALSIGEARGAAMVAAIRPGMVFHEYGPSQVKESI